MAGTWFGIAAFSLIGSAFGIAGLVRLAGLLWLRSNGTPVTGQVVRLARDRSIAIGQRPYTPVAEFEANGQRYEARGSGSFPPLYRVGDSVQVYYQPGRPDRGQIVTGRESAIAWLFLALGFVFGFGALAIARLR